MSLGPGLASCACVTASRGCGLGRGGGDALPATTRRGSRSSPAPRARTGVTPQRAGARPVGARRTPGRVQTYTTWAARRGLVHVCHGKRTARVTRPCPLKSSTKTPGARKGRGRVAQPDTGDDGRGPADHHPRQAPRGCRAPRETRVVARASAHAKLSD